MDGPAGRPGGAGGAAKELADRQTGVLDQLALAELIDSGGLDRHIRRSRLRYRRRRDELVAALGTVPAIGSEGSPPACTPSWTSRRTARPSPRSSPRWPRSGVGVHGLGRYWHRPRPRRPGLVVGFGTPAEHAFPAALAALTDGLQRAVAGSLP